MARFTGGYIKLYRQAFEGDIGTNGHCFALWCALLCMATWRETQLIADGEKRILPAGTVVTGTRELSEKLSFSKDTVIRWLKYLEKTDRVAVSRTTRGSIVTIHNWAQYQAQSQEAETDASHQPSSSRPVAVHQPTLIEEVKKRRKKEKTYSSVFDLEAAYENYPLKEGKSKGIQKLSREIKTQEDYEALLRAIDKYSRSEKVSNGYIKLFSTFASEWRDWTAQDVGLRATPSTPVKSAEIKRLDAEEAEIGRQYEAQMARIREESA